MDYNIISITFINMFLSLALSFIFFICLSSFIYYLQGKDIGEYPSILFGDMPFKQTITTFFIVIIFTIFMFMMMVNKYEKPKPEKKKEYTINFNMNHTFTGKNSLYEERFNH